ncbi:LysR family transcriptional regulator [Acuticoccus kandeliae]|uniref:LysR family transcriptional regulator n=1 Tax=Acuticoccus kandeliae TaxID=2073160 RepID=UPI000D3E6F1D|nr:LysR family transcriptional regulator [Acuticoccus kandeliae]
MPVGLVPQIQQSASLRYFYEVAQHGSFSAAGEVLRIAPSAVNRQIKLLETELGTELFDRGRGRNSCRLTAAGEALLYRVNRAMQELALARSEVDALQGLKRGRVSLGVNETIGREFAVGFIADFCKDHPAVSFEVTCGNSPMLLDLLLADQVDIVVALGVAARREIEVVAASPIHLYAMMPADHPMAQAAAISLDTLASERLILPGPEIMLRRLVDTMLVAADLERTPKLVTNSFELMADLVRAGLGFGMQTRSRAGVDSLRPGITYVPLEQSPAVAGLLACCVRRGRTPSAAMSHCMRRIKSRFEDWLDEGDAPPRGQGPDQTVKNAL